MSNKKWRQRSLVGLRFGKLEVKSLSKSVHLKGGRWWLCHCDCGHVVEVPTGRLTTGNTSSCGCVKKALLHPDLVGQRFGKLLVLEPAGLRKHHSLWKCSCDCGNETLVRTGHLRRRQVRSCGCLRWGEGKVPLGGRHLEPGEALRNVVIKMYQDNARHTGLEWSLSKNDMIKLLSGNCHYCGCPPSRTRKETRKYGSFTYNGIDRKDNTIGYILENSVSCCTLCNFKKGSMPYYVFKSWIEKVAHHFCNL